MPFVDTSKPIDFANIDIDALLDAANAGDTSAL
jgi:hypothetical protein